MKKLLIATGNKGKFPEMKVKLDGLDLEVLNLRDVGIPPGIEVEEPAMTFEGNAIIKAIMWAKKTGLMTMADDSGLEIDALGGRPGVYSARYVEGTDEDRYKKILEEMKSIPEERRGAQFTCTIAIYDPATDKVRTCNGICRGKIISEPRGNNGFGYDPVFFYDEMKKTIAEMALEEKNEISHRGKALEKAKEIIREEFL